MSKSSDYVDAISNILASIACSNQISRQEISQLQQFIQDHPEFRTTRHTYPVSAEVQIEAMETVLASLRVDIDNYKSQVAALTKENEDLKKQVQQRQDKIEFMNKQIAQLTPIMDGLINQSFPETHTCDNCHYALLAAPAFPKGRCGNGKVEGWSRRPDTCQGFKEKEIESNETI
jgi:hypothetical protein